MPAAIESGCALRCGTGFQLPRSSPHPDSLLHPQSEELASLVLTRWNWQVGRRVCFRVCHPIMYQGCGHACYLYLTAPSPR